MPHPDIHQSCHFSTSRHHKADSAKMFWGWGFILGSFWVVGGMNLKFVKSNLNISRTWITMSLFRANPSKIWCHIKETEYIHFIEVTEPPVFNKTQLTTCLIALIFT
jgi:hypothetical protein